MPTTIDFSEFYSKKQFNAYTKSREVKSTEGAGQEETDAWYAHVKIYEKSILSYLHARADAGDLPLIAFGERRGLPFVDSWNRLVNKEKPGPWDESELIESTSGTLFLASSLQADYEKLLELTSSGRFNKSTGECKVTGKHLTCQMNDWTPVLGRTEYVDGKHVFQPVDAEAPMPSVKHAMIQAPSGELLTADWFRIPQFNSQVRPEDRPIVSVNTLSGQHHETNRCATRFCFAHVFVSNTSPSIYETDGKFLIGREIYDCEDNEKQAFGSPEGTIVAKVCTDMWWATIIDRAVLTELVSRNEVGMETAEKIVADYIADSSNGVSVIKVNAGQVLHLYYESEEGLQNRFKADGVNDAGFECLNAVLSAKPLDWAPVKEKKAVPRP